MVELINLNKDGKAFYTPVEVAALLSVHRRTVMAYMKSGKLKAVNIANGKVSRYRITKESLQEFCGN